MKRSFRPFHALSARFLCMALLVVLISACATPGRTDQPPSASGLDDQAAADYYFLLYQDLARMGRVDEALEVMEKLLGVSSSVDLYLDLANAYWQAGNTEKTISLLRDGVKRYPEDKRLYFYLTNAYLATKRFADAASVIGTYIRVNPRDYEAKTEAAAIFVEAGQFAEALDMLKDVPKEHANAAQHYYQARAHAGLGRVKKAIEILHRTVKEEQSLVPAWALLAQLQENEGDFAAAETTYRRLLDVGGESPEVWLRLLRLALRQNNVQKALSMLKQGPKDRAFLLDVVALFVEEGKAQAAKSIFAQMGKDQQDHPEVLLFQAVLAYEADKDAREALRLLSRVPQSHAVYERALNFQVQIQSALGETDAALAGAKLGQQRFGKPEFHILESMVLEKAERMPEALAALEAVQDQFPTDIDLLYRKGGVLERLGRRDEAVKVMESILAMDPSHAEAANFVGYSLAEAGKDLDRAMALVQVAVKQQPGNVFFIDSLAWVHFKRGKVDKAWEDIRRAVAEDVPDPTIWEHYGDIAKAMGDKREAHRGYTRALQLGSDAKDLQTKLRSVE